MEGYVTRLQIEAKELAEKINNLQLFLVSDAGLSIDYPQFCDLTDQLVHMRNYFDALLRRLSRNSFELGGA